LTSDVRNHALTYASVQTENPQSLNIDSWRIVKAAGASADECKRALRLAEVAVTMQPRVDEFHNTLALALYRLGRHTEAIASARQAAALRSRPSDSDAIITVLARIRLGETTGVEAELARLVTAASKSSSSDLKALVQEAVGLVKSASRR
jgi:hypothetical protein